MTAGSLYVLTNPRIKGIKIGVTRRNPKVRAEELFDTSVPTPFKVYMSIKTRDIFDAENVVHDALDRYRIHPNREFFSCPALIARIVIVCQRASGKL